MLCESCRGPFPPSSHAPAGKPPGRALEDSFLLLPRPQQQALLHGADAASPRGEAQVLAHVHDQVQHATRLIDLGRTAAEAECQVSLCADCATFVLADLEARVREVAEQHGAILAVLDDERRRAAAEPQPQWDVSGENARIARDEAAIESELIELVEQQQAVGAELAALEAEEAALEVEADAFWVRCNAAQLAAIERADTELHHAQLLAHCSRELRRLKATSVLDDVFDIWFDGPFGTLNGLRLGRLPTVQVEWAEINAALGHAALLVDTLASAHHLRFPKHTLHLMGSFTKIAHNDEPKTLLELHGSGSLQLGRIFSGTRFDRALAMFLQCIGALLSHARRTASASLGDAPYRIEEDKIGTADGMLSIRLQFNQDELWTRALKYMLTDLKWLLAWHTQVTAAAAAVGTASASPRAAHAQPGGLSPPGPQQR